MKQQALIDLLADYADALNKGAEQDDAAEWLADYSRSFHVPSVVALLQLARAVKRVLVPVTPSLLFQSELKGRLLQADDFAVEKRPLPKTIWLGAAVSIIGLAVFLLRRVRLAGGGAVTAV